MVFQRCFTFLFILLNLFLSTTKVLRNPIKNINITAKLKHYTNVLFFQTIFVCNVLLTILPLSQKTADKLFGKILWNNRLKRNILSNKIERGRDVKCQDIKSLVKNAKSTFQRKLFLFYSEWASRFRETAWNDVVLTNYPTIKSFRTDRRILNVFPNVCPIDWITLNLTVNRKTSCFRLKTKKVVFYCCNYGNDYYFRMNWT
jgi:hypothetical protein